MPFTFPRLASVNAANAASQAPTFSRYGCIIAPLGFASGVAALKALNSAATVLCYIPCTIQRLDAYSGGSFSNGLIVDPQWWLGVALPSRHGRWARRAPAPAP